MTIRTSTTLLVFFLATTPGACAAAPETIALWLFDEQAGLYPSSLLSNARANGLSMALGRGGRIVPGRFGNALQPIDPQPHKTTNRWPKEQQVLFGLSSPPRLPGRNAEPLTWETANFCALLTCGETHLRRMNFANSTDTPLNLGAFDWTVEFWFQAVGDLPSEGVVFEVGSGPRGENDLVTRLSLTAQGKSFRLVNHAAGLDLDIPTASRILADGEWHHVALSFHAARHELLHWIDGRKLLTLGSVKLNQLPHGDEAYFSVGRNGLWQHPLPGRLDELRLSTGLCYADDFSPPGSFSRTYCDDRPAPTLVKGPPLLFPSDRVTPTPVELGRRKHLLIDDALIEEADGVTWSTNPPRVAELVLEEFYGHLSVVEDEAGVIRMYAPGPHDTLVVYTSRDGVHFDEPDLGRGEYHGKRNVVIRQPVGLGEVFIDPCAQASERWKYVSGVKGQGIFVFSSADGYEFHRHETAALPFAAGSQSNVFYDDQRQLFVGYHRSDYGAPSTTSRETERRFVLTEVNDLLRPWDFHPVTTERTRKVARRLRIKSHLLDPWYLENGPLSPAGFGIEFPVVFGPDEDLDPPHTDIYSPKAAKYALAPDTYLAFPVMYFHYWDVDTPAREELGSVGRDRGSGVMEMQTMVSRDGRQWKRYPRPAYVGVGEHGSRGAHFMVKMVQGMVCRGDEIWQYFTSSPNYHSAWKEGRWGGKKGVFRLVQRRDGFVSVDSDYTGGRIVTKPFRMAGSRLELNIDTGAVGFAQVGILAEGGQPLPGFAVDKCVYINGNFVRAPVEWLEKGTDLSGIAGRVIRLEIRSRGTRLFAMQFVD